jgi:YidC/Oxa1 family membrane protein insertase
MLDPLYEAIGWLLSIFYSVIPNLGVSIILLTFTIMLLLYPLTAKQARSMIAMQMHQPEIKRIQAKYKNDRQKMNEEVMKYYQEHKINPLAGCLPLVVQLPIFFALFQVLRNPYKYVPDDSKLYEAFCTTKSGVLASVQQCSGDKAPFKALPIHQEFIGVDLSVSAPNQITTWATIVAFSFVLLSVLSGFMQSRQASRRTPQTNKQMATIMKVLPVAFGLFSLQFPAGLVLYFCVSNFWRLGQQEVIFRRFGTAANPTHRAVLKPAKARVVDVDSRERTEAEDDDDADGEQPLELESGPATKSAKAPAPKARAGDGKPASTKGSAKPATKPASKSGTANGAKPVAPPAKTGGGLRSFFQLPPPPGEIPKAAPAKPATSKPSSSKPSSSAAKKATSTSSSTSSTTARPGTTGRRTSKKKRKR